MPTTISPRLSKFARIMRKTTSELGREESSGHYLECDNGEAGHGVTL